jgi:hypothetical protein
VDFVKLKQCLVFFRESLLNFTFLNFYVTLRAKDLCSHSIYFSTKKMLVPSFRKMMVKIVQYCSISNVGIGILDDCDGIQGFIDDVYHH